ncbi:tRNA (adenosine(37)-N6)-threonylcarbamoyltransferase complex dimerization subunit type 1 TsaB [Rubrobacter indicoceani]|uniref:tRNA (adenosine(37)-N6)-threonylcarbamoyltransferase complex dimerization subunit type 1 TsaB n=1 Tax=Rubrobacter indicoceani TaxID=2051957 RepID=UPI000E5AEA5B|nr:tRNA (adenosine(37)-N6)-threonylcarbamoyltransferase complex dimerization subunit type 1 TsaB [Rubrobacter indicoceani]
MLVLALDASTPTTSVAIGEPDAEARRILAQVELPGAGASETLLRAADAALLLCGRDFSEVQGIVVGVGPGTFTGIRIACATARSLALGSGAVLMSGSTLAALATPALSVRPEVLAVLDARRGEVFARKFSAGAFFDPERPGDTGLEGIFCGTPEKLASSGTETDPGRKLLVVGDGAVRYRDKLSVLGDIPPDGSPLNRVSAAGHLLSGGFHPVEAGEIVPVYVREPDAEVRRDLNPWLGG